MNFMPDRTCLAFDPAPDGFAYALIQASGKQFVRIETGQIKGTGKWSHLINTLQSLEAEHLPSLVAVETVSGGISKARLDRTRNPAGINMQELISTATCAGVLVGAARNPDRVFQMPANNQHEPLKSWRMHLTRLRFADDAAVAQSLNVWLASGLPVKGHRTVSSGPYDSGKMTQTVYVDNNHKRDALGLAVIALALTT
jgi:hypothetical protein